MVTPDAVRSGCRCGSDDISEGRVELLQFFL